MLWWLISASIILSIATFFLGFYIRGIIDKIKDLEKTISMKVSKPIVAEEPKSEVLDPLDEVQTAVYEHNKMMERLNE